jgi:hypothetical protein
MKIVHSVSNSRFAIVESGNGYAVENKATGEREGWRKTFAAAERLKRELSDNARAGKVRR